MARSLYRKSGSCKRPVRVAETPADDPRRRQRGRPPLLWSYGGEGQASPRLRWVQGKVIRCARRPGSFALFPSRPVSHTVTVRGSETDTAKET